MEIERINENTVKFFLSYLDIEERGFTREEVWYNREKSEELFWDMMDEINDEAEFEAEGPLWIQVHAQNNGIEVTVTRANSSDAENAHAFDQDDPQRIFQHPDESFQRIDDDDDIDPTGIQTAGRMENTFVFNEFEDVIKLASRMHGYAANTVLYSYENKYYIHVSFDEEMANEQQREDMGSVLLEFGTPSPTTIHILEEYGNIIMDSDVFMQIEEYF